MKNLLSSLSPFLLTVLLFTGCGMFEPIPDFIRAHMPDGTPVPAVILLDSGQDVTIEVTCLFPWCIEKPNQFPAWLTVTPTTGCTGTQSVTISVTTEALGEEHALVFLSAMGLRLTVTVMQTPPPPNEKSISFIRKRHLPSCP